jgi:hypothetical protein
LALGVRFRSVKIEYSSYRGGATITICKFQRIFHPQIFNAGQSSLEKKDRNDRKCWGDGIFHYIPSLLIGANSSFPTPKFRLQTLSPSFINIKKGEPLYSAIGSTPAGGVYNIEFCDYDPTVLSIISSLKTLKWNRPQPEF